MLDVLMQHGGHIDAPRWNYISSTVELYLYRDVSIVPPWKGEMRHPEEIRMSGFMYVRSGQSALFSSSLGLMLNSLVKQRVKYLGSLNPHS